MKKQQHMHQYEQSQDISSYIFIIWSFEKLGVSMKNHD